MYIYCSLTTASLKNINEIYDGEDNLTIINTPAEETPSERRTAGTSNQKHTKSLTSFQIQ